MRLRAEDPFVKANAFNLGEEYDVIDVLSAYLDFDERSHLNDEKVCNSYMKMANNAELSIKFWLIFTVI